MNNFLIILVFWAISFRTEKLPYICIFPNLWSKNWPALKTASLRLNQLEVTKDLVVQCLMDHALDKWMTEERKYETIFFEAFLRNDTGNRLISVILRKFIPNPTRESGYFFIFFLLQGFPLSYLIVTFINGSCRSRAVLWKIRHIAYPYTKLFPRIHIRNVRIRFFDQNLFFKIVKKNIFLQNSKLDTAIWIAVLQSDIPARIRDTPTLRIRFRIHIGDSPNVAYPYFLQHWSMGLYMDNFYTDLIHDNLSFTPFSLFVSTEL